MSEITPDRVELSEQKTHNKVLLGVVAGLVLLVQGFFTYLISSTGTEVRETNHTLTEMVTTVRVAQAQMGYLQQQVAELQSNKKEAAEVHKVHDARLNSLEQRLALHDQWIQAHNK